MMVEETAEEKRVVEFLGPRASYTHQAALDTFPSTTSYTLTPATTIEDVFAAVQSRAAYRGVVPFENSSNGSVVFTLDLFADLQSKYPDITVVDEAYVRVQHCLLGWRQEGTSTGVAGTTGAGIIPSPLSSGAATPTSHSPRPLKPTARPLANLTNIRKIYSHPQAWGQCKVFLNTYLKGIERQDVSSTSRAAELVAHDESGEAAAVSSSFAAEIYGLDVLARGIEDRADNTTRFFVLGRKDSSESAATPSPAPSAPAIELQDGLRWKTLISFTIDHSNPGALAHSLSIFSAYSLNLTSINTRPSGVENWNYIFFVEIQGRKLPGTEHGPVNKALKDLSGVCRGWRWLGSWESRFLR